MRPAHRWLIAGAMAAGGVSGCDAPHPIVLGVSSSPTFVDAARLAIQDELAEGPIPGLDTLMIEESSNRAAPAIDAAERFIGRSGIVAVVGHSNSAASLAAAPIYNEREVVQVAPTSSAVVFSEAGPFSFRLVPRDDGQGAFLAGQVARLLPDGGDVALLYVNDDYGRGLREAVLASLDRSRHRVVADLPHVEAEVTAAHVEYMRSSLRAAAPDLVLYLGRGSVLAVPFIDVIDASAPGVPILGGDALGGGGVGTPEGPPWDRVQYAGYVDLERLESAAGFRERFIARFGRRATGPDALFYDATRMVLAGVRAGARSGPELRAYLMTLGRERPAYAGVTGPVSFDANGDVERPFVLKLVVQRRSGG